MKNRAIRSAAFTVVLACCLGTANAYDYSISDIGYLSGYGQSVGAAVNASGQVAGYSFGYSGYDGLLAQSFLWQNGAMTDLGTLPSFSRQNYSTALNNSGQVVGYSNLPVNNNAFFWQESGMSNLAPSATTGYLYPNSINSTAQVAGWIYGGNNGAYNNAFLWQNGNLQLLLPGIDSRAIGINDSGQVVGYSSTVTGGHGFIWQNGNLTDLGDLPGGIDSSMATGINARGEVVGSSGTSTGWHGFIWQSGTMTDLGDLPGGDDYSNALAINAGGSVVGYSESSTGKHAFLWQSGSLTDLNSTASLAPGWMLTEAVSINDKGQILANGTDGNYQRAFLLTPMAPVPEPQTWAMLIAGFVTVSATRRRNRTPMQPEINLGA